MKTTKKLPLAMKNSQKFEAIFYHIGIFNFYPGRQVLSPIQIHKWEIFFPCTGKGIWALEKKNKKTIVRIKKGVPNSGNSIGKSLRGLELILPLKWCTIHNISPGVLMLTLHQKCSWLSRVVILLYLCTLEGLN